MGLPTYLVAMGGTSSSGDLEITYFVDVVRDGNDLRWARMYFFV
jgi:hypothetical protein